MCTPLLGHALSDWLGDVTRKPVASPRSPDGIIVPRVLGPLSPVHVPSILLLSPIDHSRHCLVHTSNCGEGTRIVEALETSEINFRYRGLTLLCNALPRSSRT